MYRVINQFQKKHLPIFTFIADVETPFIKEDSPPNCRSFCALLRRNGAPFKIVNGEFLDISIKSASLVPALNEFLMETIGAKQPVTPFETFEFTPTRYDQLNAPVSVIICTYNRPKNVKRCLDSLTFLNDNNFEVIVVNNYHEEFSTTDLNLNSYPSSFSVRVIHEPAKGLSRARNRGLQEAHHNIVAFIDDDVVVDPMWLTHIRIGFNKSSEVKSVTGFVFPGELKTESQLMFEFLGGFNRGRDFQPKIFSQKNTELPLFPYSSFFVGAGANMAFSTDFLRDSVGGFNEALGAGTPSCGGEDLDIFFQILKCGASVAYEPSALVTHFHEANYEKLLSKMYDYGISVTSYLAKLIHEEPLRFFELTKHFKNVPTYLLNHTKKSNLISVDPNSWVAARLIALKAIGMGVGPLYYLKSLKELKKQAGI